MTKRGKFIVFEGNEGAGKTTQAKRLVERLKENGIQATYEKEPSYGPVGDMLRKVFLYGGYHPDPDLAAFLWSGDRYDHITHPTNGLLTRLENGINVICDRYYLSSIVYQSFQFRETDHYWEHISRVLNMNSINHNRLTPDMTIMIQIPPEMSLNRVAKRGEALSIFEGDFDRLKSIYNTYNDAITYLKKTWKEEVTIIDGADDYDRIHDRIWSIVYPLLNQE